jgi:hypothetical protein
MKIQLSKEEFYEFVSAELILKGLSIKGKIEPMKHHSDGEYPPCEEPDYYLIEVE